MTKEQRKILIGLAFLAPNILGVLLFTVIPLIFSVVLAFTNWDLRLHNMFKDDPLSYVGLDNFSRLFSEGDFYIFFGNTLYFMIGIPFGMAGSLIAAILLSRDMGNKNKRTLAWVLSVATLIFSLFLLLIVGMDGSAMSIMVVGLLGIVTISGISGGQTVYRTFFYTPHFTAGVATFILWKKLYNPNGGAINNILNPIMGDFSKLVQACPSGMMGALGWLSTFLGLALFVKCFLKHRKAWLDSDAGTTAFFTLSGITLIPVIVGYFWSQTAPFKVIFLIIILITIAAMLYVVFAEKRIEVVPHTKGMEHQLMIQLIFMTVHFALLGLAPVLLQLEGMASDGLEAPKWLVDYYWAKPAIMIMGLWGAIGSNNMLLYLAALTNVPQDLYEAAEIDGANSIETFWNVTWPQLAPTTFFIFIMSLIYGLQGGMEMAKTMTNGGPAGSTTTLSYFIYSEGFETGRLGYASAISWALFFLVFTVTMVNWKFGNKKN